MKKKLAKKIVGCLMRKFDLIDDNDTLIKEESFESLQRAKRPYIPPMYNNMITDNMLDGVYFLKNHIKKW